MRFERLTCGRIAAMRCHGGPEVAAMAELDAWGSHALRLQSCGEEIAEQPCLCRGLSCGGPHGMNRRRRGFQARQARLHIPGSTSERTCHFGALAIPRGPRAQSSGCGICRLDFRRAAARRRSNARPTSVGFERSIVRRTSFVPTSRSIAVTIYRFWRDPGYATVPFRPGDCRCLATVKGDAL